MYYTREMDTREIAELLDISRNTVTTRLARGRELLKRELEGGKIYGWINLNFEEFYGKNMKVSRRSLQTR